MLFRHSDKNHTRLGSMTEIESHSSVMYDPMHRCACTEMSFLVTGHKIICYMYLKKRVESLNLNSQKEWSSWLSLNLLVWRRDIVDLLRLLWMILRRINTHTRWLNMGLFNPLCMSCKHLWGIGTISILPQDTWYPCLGIVLTLFNPLCMSCKHLWEVGTISLPPQDTWYPCLRDCFDMIGSHNHVLLMSCVIGTIIETITHPFAVTDELWVIR